jgi:hypothetical protein
MRVGELLEMGNAATVNSGEMSEPRVERPDVGLTAIKAEPDRPVIADGKDFVGYRAEIPHIPSDRSEDVLGDFSEAAIDTAVRATGRLDPVRVADQPAESFRVPGCESSVQVRKNVRCVAHTRSLV